MDSERTAGQSGDRAVARPSPDDFCGECGDAMGHEWVSYGLDPRDPRSVIEHFGGIVLSGPVEPRPERPKRRTRDFRDPEDLGVYFHPWCAPRIKLPEKVQEKLAKVLARLLVADYRKRSERWATVAQLGAGQFDPPRCPANVASVHGHRVFTMTRPEWERLRAHEGELVELEFERTQGGSLGEAASAIVSLAAECSVHTGRIEVWRHHPTDPPTPSNVHDYLVLENLTRRVNVPAFAERASTEDSPKLRKHLREHVFVVKEQPGKGRWEPKARVIERIVFLAV